MPKAFYNERTVAAGDETLRLVINFRAIDAIESLLDRPFNDVLADLNAGAPKLGMIAQVLWGFLREHHAELDIDQVTSLLFGSTGLAMGVTINELLAAAFPSESEGEAKAKGKNPRAPRGASKPS